MNKRYEKQGKHFGFTLTEAVITLVAIGLIAILTAPSLLKNYQKQELYSKFMHSYSELENLLPRLMKEMGPVWKWSDDNCADIVDYMNVVRECNDARDCFAPSYQTRPAGGGTTKATSEHFAPRPSGGQKTRTVELVDGSTIQVHMSTRSLSFPDSFSCFIILDTNGKKGPNKYNRDLFFLQYLTFNKLYPYGEGYNVPGWDRHGLTQKPIFMTAADEELREKCITGGANASPSCISLMLREGKMNY